MVKGELHRLELQLPHLTPMLPRLHRCAADYKRQQLALLDWTCRADNNGFEKFLRKAMEFALTVLLSGLITPVALSCAQEFFICSEEELHG